MLQLRYLLVLQGIEQIALGYILELDGVYGREEVADIVVALGEITRLGLDEVFDASIRHIPLGVTQEQKSAGPGEEHDHADKDGYAQQYSRP